MQNVSTDFLAAVRESHEVVVDARVVAGDAVLATLAVTSGTVEVDGSADIRRHMNCVVVDDTGLLTPAAAQDLLMPFGTEVQLRRGVRLSTGDELVSLGIFRITSTTVDETQSGVTISLEGYDRAERYDRSIGKTFHIRSGTSVPSAIVALMNAQYPGAAMHFMNSAHTVPTLLYNPNDKSWGEGRKLAESIGAELFFDPLGVMTLSPSPAIGSGQVVQSFSDAEAQVIIEMQKAQRSSDVINGVIVEGTSPTGAPVTGVAWDDDPRSPTYYKGRFGPSPLSIRLETVTSQGQANLAAKARLQKELGVSEVIEFPMVVNPALDAGDIVRIDVAAARVHDLYILDRLSIPLDAGSPMRVNGRRRTQTTAAVA